MGRGDAMTAASLEACPACRERDELRESQTFVSVSTISIAHCGEGVHRSRIFEFVSSVRMAP